MYTTLTKTDLRDGEPEDGAHDGAHHAVHPALERRAWVARHGLGDRDWRPNRLGWFVVCREVLWSVSVEVALPSRPHPTQTQNTTACAATDLQPQMVVVHQHHDAGQQHGEPHLQRLPEALEAREPEGRAAPPAEEGAVWMYICCSLGWVGGVLSLNACPQTRTGSRGGGTKRRCGPSIARGGRDGGSYRRRSASRRPPRRAPGPARRCCAGSGSCTWHGIGWWSRGVGRVSALSNQCTSPINHDMRHTQHARTRSSPTPPGSAAPPPLPPPSAQTRWTPATACAAAGRAPTGAAVATRAWRCRSRRRWRWGARCPRCCSGCARRWRARPPPAPRRR